MNPNESTIIACVARLLDRKAMPRRLEGKPLAQEDEIDAIYEAVKRNAPRMPERVALWWPIFQRLLSEQCGHGWPTEKEIKQAGEEATASLPKPLAPSSAAAKEGHYALIAAKINNHEAVGEGCLYGVEAVELIKRSW